MYNPSDYDGDTLESRAADELDRIAIAEADAELMLAWEMATEDDGAPITVTPLIAAQRWAAAMGLQIAA